MADGVTGIDWVDAMIGANTAQDGGTAKTDATVSTDAAQGASSTKASGGTFTDFLYANGGKALDYIIKKDAAKTSVQNAVALAPLQPATGFTLSPTMLIAGGAVLVLVLVLRK
jgi:hypothetical protein